MWRCQSGEPDTCQFISSLKKLKSLWGTTGVDEMAEKVWADPGVQDQARACPERGEIREGQAGGWEEVLWWLWIYWLLLLRAEVIWSPACPLGIMTFPIPPPVHSHPGSLSYWVMEIYLCPCLESLGCGNDVPAAV